MSKGPLQSQYNQVPEYSIEVKFDRSNSTYKPKMVSGTISLIHRSGGAFQQQVNVLISVSGSIVVQNRNNRAQVQQIRKRAANMRMIYLPDIPVADHKSINQDSKIPFKFKLQRGEHPLLQTYIGVYINISYNLFAKVTLTDKRSFQQDTPFYAQVPGAGRDSVQQFIHPKPKSFVFSTDDIKGDRSKVPNFKVRGELESQICYFSDDLHGWIVVDMADSPIRQIDLQMIRVESIQVEGGSVSEKTQIQLIQICDGNVTRNLEIPLYMILPRYYSCPSVQYQWCSVNFQVNLQLIFRDGYKVTTNIPLKIIRK